MEFESNRKVPPTNWIEQVPLETWSMIVKHLKVEELSGLMKSCHFFFTLLSNPKLYTHCSETGEINLHWGIYFLREKLVQLKNQMLVATFQWYHTQSKSDEDYFFFNQLTKQNRLLSLIQTTVVMRLLHHIQQIIDEPWNVDKLAFGLAPAASAFEFCATSENQLLRTENFRWKWTICDLCADEDDIWMPRQDLSEIDTDLLVRIELELEHSGDEVVECIVEVGEPLKKGPWDPRSSPTESPKKPKHEVEMKTFSYSFTLYPKFTQHFSFYHTAGSTFCFVIYQPKMAHCCSNMMCSLVHVHGLEIVQQNYDFRDVATKFNFSRPYN